MRCCKLLEEVLYCARTYVHPFNENTVWLMLVNQSDMKREKMKSEVDRCARGHLVLSNFD